MKQQFEEVMKLSQEEMVQYEKCGKALFEVLTLGAMNKRVLIDEATFHLGLEYWKACKKFEVISNLKHTEEEIERRLQQIDVDIPVLGEILKHDLEYRGVLLSPTKSIK